MGLVEAEGIELTDEDLEGVADGNIFKKLFRGIADGGDIGIGDAEAIRR